MVISLIAAGSILTAALLFRFNGLWIYRWWDRSLRNVRERLPREYEIPRYCVTNPDGSVNYEARWPGWDGWYFFVIPDDRDLPTKMIRASLMTGLYGLEGIDNYDRLPPGLAPSKAAELLCMVPAAAPTPAGNEKLGNLSQRYLPKALDLRMERDKLEIAMGSCSVSGGVASLPYGRIAGSWPDYQFRFHHPEADIRIELTYHGENLVWWADIPGIFTYLAAFGRFEGTVTYGQDAARPGPRELPPAPSTHSIRGRGAFEHGFARGRFSYDPLFLPFRLLTRVFPSLRPVRYHYELLIGDDNLHGGFMLASAFGVKVRDRGGVYLDGRYVPIDAVTVTYHDDPPPDAAQGHGPGRSEVPFYRRWTVQAKTIEGDIDYTGVREWPLAPVAPNMTYYHFSYEGTCAGAPIRGRGYGEYVRL